MMTNPPMGRDALVAYVMGLAMACPIEQDNPCDCPLHLIRQKSVGERLAWIKSLDDKDLMKVATTHCACIEKKLNQQS